MTMRGAPQPDPERHGNRQPDLVLMLVDRWAQQAMQRPWRHAAGWAVGIGVANLGLRMLLNDRSLVHNVRLAVVTGVGFLLFAWLYTAQLTRPLRRHRSQGATKPASPEPWPPPRPSPPPCRLASSSAKAAHLAEARMSSSQAGVEGHQWRLHHNSGARLPCRIVCQCGWTSAAGPSTTTLLELKGHLEDSLHNGAQLIHAHDQPSHERPQSHPA